MIKMAVGVVSALGVIGILFASLFLEFFAVVCIAYVLSLMHNSPSTTQPKSAPSSPHHTKSSTDANTNQTTKSGSNASPGPLQHSSSSVGIIDLNNNNTNESPAGFLFSAVKCWKLDDMPDDGAKLVLRWLDKMRALPGYNAVDVGVVPLHIFKPRSYARPRDGFMRVETLLPSSHASKHVLHAYLVMWQGKTSAVGDPTNIIALMENGFKNYEIGRINLKTRPSQVRLIPRPFEKSLPVPCFQVGSAKILGLSSHMRDYCVPVEKAKLSLVGVSYKPIEFDSDDDDTEGGSADDEHHHNLFNTT